MGRVDGFRERVAVLEVLRRELPALFERFFPNASEEQRRALEALLAYIDSRIAVMHGVLAVEEVEEAKREGVEG